nr:immunoglobulin light chain junction region [Macaca mulatta]
CLQDFQLPPTF